MVLHARDPAARDVARESAVFGVGAVELLVLDAVVVRGALEGVALDREHAALDGGVVAQDLRVGRRDPRRRAAVLDIVLQVDAVLPATQHEGLGDGDARRGVAPGERYAQFIRTVGQRIRRRWRAERSEVRGAGAARAGVAEAGLQGIELPRGDVQQLYGGLFALYARIDQEVGAHEGATL